MILSSALLLLAAASSCGVYGVELTQPPSMVVKPQESFSISCRISVSTYCIHWIRQPTGKALEWLGYLCTDGSIRTKDSVKNKISFTQDTSKNTVFLQGKNFQTEDTAVYYCARAWPNAFDYWGKGTKVTVSSAQASAPKSIFALSQCSADSSGFLTIGCLARGFSPADSLTFKWTDSAKKELTDFVQYPAFGSDGDYTKISHLRVRKSDWDPTKPYTCEASNSKGKKDTSLAPSPKVPTTPPKVPTTPPKVVTPSAGLTLMLKPPIERELFVNNKTVLQAVVSGGEKDAVEKASVSCTPYSVMPAGVSRENSRFIKIHKVTVDTKTWFNGATVTCAIDRDIKDTISFNKGDEKKPSVTIYRPDVIDKDKHNVSLVCEVTSANLGDVYIMWKVSDGPYTEAITSAPISQKDSTTVLSMLTVPKNIYINAATTVTCAVKHANMENIYSPTQATTSKSKRSEISCD